MKFIIILLLCINLIHANNLQSLLDEYKNNSDLSNNTIDENIGHLTIFTQDQLKKMQYNKLSDILKELRFLNLNNNRFGTKNLSNAGFKTSISTSVKLFINNHEVSSIYTLSPFATWDDLPLDFISHIEVYNGNSSFSVGNEPGVNYIKIYTKSPYRLNATKLETSFSNNKNRSLGITQSTTLDNNWAYLFYSGIQKKFYKKTYNNQALYNNSTKRYLYLTLQKENQEIDLAYADILKDNFIGYSIDSTPNDGELKARDYYISYTNLLLNDKSLKTSLSIDVNERKYFEENVEGILFPTLPIYYAENFKFEKYNAYIAKDFESKNNKLLVALNANIKKKTKDNSTEYLSDFNKESVYSFIIEDKYKINDKVYLTANAKFDKYIKEDNMKNSSENILRIGSIYMPTQNLGFKFFLAKSYIPPTFFYVDFAKTNNKNLDSQKIKYASLESVYSKDNYKISAIVSKIKASDIIALDLNGFYNVPIEVDSISYTLNYDYTFDNKDTLQLNFYKANSSQAQNDSASGGYIKYMGKYKEFDYFTSLIYKKGYQINDFVVKSGYDLSLGSSYDITKNLTFSLKAENILNKSIKTLYSNYSNSSFFTLRDNDRTYTASIKWVF
jgi:hypothetical protein